MWELIRGEPESSSGDVSSLLGTEVRVRWRGPEPDDAAAIDALLVETPVPDPTLRIWAGRCVRQESDLLERVRERVIRHRRWRRMLLEALDGAAPLHPATLAYRFISLTTQLVSLPDGLVVLGHNKQRRRHWLEIFRSGALIRRIEIPRRYRVRLLPPLRRHDVEVALELGTHDATGYWIVSGSGEPIARSAVPQSGRRWATHFARVAGGQDTLQLCGKRGRAHARGRGAVRRGVSAAHRQRACAQRSGRRRRLDPGLRAMSRERPDHDHGRLSRGAVRVHRRRSGRRGERAACGMTGGRAARALT